MKVRELRQADEPFIFSSWLKSYRKHPSVITQPNNKYFKNYHTVIEFFLQTGKVLVCCSSEDENEILGWACLKDSKPVYVYVKQALRRLGVGSLLVGKDFILSLFKGN